MEEGSNIPRSRSRAPTGIGVVPSMPAPTTHKNKNLKKKEEENTHVAITPLTSQDLGTPHALTQFSTSSSSLPVIKQQAPLFDRNEYDIQNKNKS